MVTSAGVISVSVAWAYEILASHGVVYSRMSGTVTAADFAAAREAAAADPRFDDSFSHLVDMRNCRLALSTPEIESLARWSISKPSTRRALVATSDATYGLGRMYGSHRELAIDNDLTRVFRSLPEAFSWLGLNDADLLRRLESS
jgi:hypothetical protein